MIITPVKVLRPPTGKLGRGFLLPSVLFGNYRRFKSAILSNGIKPVCLALAFLFLPINISAANIRNVILCLGDGLGLSLITAVRIKTVGATGRLALETMPVTGLVTTCSADNLITDSGAAATALACGRKTKNGMIGVAADGSRLKTILEACQTRGMATGLVATSSITHATPAAFGSHVAGRGDETEIARQLLFNRITVLLGGGREYFLPAKVAGGKRTDQRDLIAEASQAGYQYCETRHQLAAASGDRILGLFQAGALKNDTLEPSLAEMTSAAIKTLRRDPDGFFLMIEGSQIDWSGHNNNFEDARQQVLWFDEAIKFCLDFAREDQQTLVLVTADHETGGLGLLAGKPSGDSVRTGWLCRDHTGTQVPLYAFGPQAERFGGVYDNTDIPKNIAQILDIPGF